MGMTREQILASLISLGNILGCYSDAINDLRDTTAERLRTGDWRTNNMSRGQLNRLADRMRAQGDRMGDFADQIDSLAGELE
jgi:hypothetical protein